MQEMLHLMNEGRVFTTLWRRIYGGEHGGPNGLAGRGGAGAWRPAGQSLRRLVGGRGGHARSDRSLRLSDLHRHRRTIADLSIGEVYYHAVAIQGDQGARDVRIYHVRAFDAGQQVIKGSTDGADAVTIGVWR